MISSHTAILYSYLFWLIGRREYGVERRRLRDVIARWFFMAHTTGRYTSSPETRIEQDMARLRSVATGDADGFCAALDRVVADTFTHDYWSITLPNQLDSSSSQSPALSAYWAALNILDAESLCSNIKVSSLLDPGVNPTRSIERHHLFPRAYLKRLGVTDVSRINQIANMTFADWPDNAEAASQPPSVYWRRVTEGLDAERLRRQQYWHALPVGWEQLDYEEFLERRRKLIAAVIRDGYERLAAEPGPPPVHDSGVEALIRAGESATVEFKSTARWSGKGTSPILKALAGFMNASGGTLLIGVDDSGEVLGLEADYRTLGKPNRDGYELFLTQLVEAGLGRAALPLVNVMFADVDGRDVCRLDVRASARPVFCRPHAGKERTEFWVRTSNSTRQLSGDDLVRYERDHWG